MISKNLLRKLAIAGALIPSTLVAMPSASQAGVFFSAGITVGFAPPALPVYVQPPCPTPGYLWTPGYWGYGSGGYYWVPGAWAEPPVVGVLWTPPYWGYAGGGYGFHPGYWGHTVGFYGGVNYGFGYGGVGFGGGYWHGSNFLYNRSVTNVNVNVIHNTYVRNVTVINNYNHVSYNGGPGGVRAQPNRFEVQAQNERHFEATSNQQRMFESARTNDAQYARFNGGRPQVASLATDRSSFGYRNEVNTREGNQQSRIAHGVDGGGLTPGETRNLEQRENGINNQARFDRQQNGGSLTNAERGQINARQNHVSSAIYADRHNANTDAAAGYRHGTTAGQERFQAHQVHQNLRPRGPQSHGFGGSYKAGGHAGGAAHVGGAPHEGGVHEGEHRR